MNELDKILVIQTAFLGDVILALPMVQTIKNHLPDSQVDFLCVPANAGILKNHKALTNVIPYDKKGGDKLDKFIEALSLIRDKEYDVIITPHRFLRSALLTFYSKAKIRIGYNRNALSFLLSHKVNYIQEKHEILRNLDLFRAIPGIESDESKISLVPDLYASEEDEKITEGYLDGIDINKFIAFAPCSRWVTKQLPVHITVEAVKNLIDEGYFVALTGGEEDKDYCRRVKQNIINNNLVNLSGKLTPVQSYLAIKRSRLLITVDSAAQHLGAAAGVPVILIYGSTDSSFGFYPLTSEKKIVEIKGLKCRPCTDHGRNKCPLGHFKCMEEIPVKSILDGVKALTEKIK